MSNRCLGVNLNDKTPAFPKDVKNGDNCTYTLLVANKGATDQQTQMLVSFKIAPQIGLPVQMNASKAGQTLTITGQIGVPVDICGPTKFTAAVDVHNVE
jgi:hypothetical protein